MKNRWASLLLAGLMTGAMAIAGFAEEATTEAAVEATTETAAEGTVYEGSSVGMQGTVTVALTVDGDTITNVELVECHETPSVASVAMERIPAQIVEHQTTTLDAVTGATFASRAIMRAADAAAEAAGLDAEALKANAYSAQPGEDEVYDTDVLVIGGGGAGISAATTAAQAGCKVILLEKSSVLGGNTLMQGGAFNAVDTDAQAGMILTEAQKNTMDAYLALDHADEALKFDEFPEWEEVLTQLQTDITDFYAANEGKTPGVDMPGFDSVALHMWHIYTGGLRQLNDGTWIASDITLARTLAENALGTINWLQDEVGVEVQSGADASSTMFTVLGAMWPRTHAFPTSTPLIDVLAGAATDAGTEIYTETKATKLLVNDEGRVVGAEAEKADGTKVTVNAAKGVILASGGYCANPAMVKEYDMYWGDALSDHTLTTNVGTNEGDGIVMATEIGADTFGLEIAQMMPSSSPVKGTMTDGIWGDAAQQIWIDANGERFVDEYAERDVLTLASLEQENGIFYIIYAGVKADETDGLLKGATMEDGLFGNTVDKMVANGHVWYGETLEDLAAQSAETPAAMQTPGFSADTLRKTIEDYNSYVANQEDPDFGKEVLSGAIDLDYIEETDGAGIVISPRKASLHHTMGGLLINENAEVLNTDGTPIAGLWAAGEVTGGIHAGNRLGGNAVADIFTFGHIAGANAAAAE